jgi:very-short-patch-repair endonuclease
VLADAWAVRNIDETSVRECAAPLDAAVAAIAARQHGVVSLAQVRALGLGDRAVQQRAARGRLHPVHRGVYTVGHPVLSADGQRMAAVVACGRAAVLSHRSAAAAWGLRATDRAHHEVTVARRHRPVPSVEVHTTRCLAPDDVTTLRAIPITSVARTLLDLAAVLGPDALERAVHQAEVIRLLDARALRAAMGRAKGRRGVARLAAILAEPDPGPTRSVLEERFLELCRRAALPRPRLNMHMPIDGTLLELDALWPRERLVVELDGAAAHRTARAFHADRRRDARLGAAGFVVMRLTWRRVTRDHEVVADELRRAFALRAASCCPP